MKILVVGKGGREHALAWKLAQSKGVEKIYCAPGNGGISKLAEIVPIGLTDLVRLADFAEEKKIDLTVVGPELPLTLGIVDIFEQRGLRIFGPTREASEIEGSKAFAKDFMQRYHIPTASFRIFSDPAEAVDFISRASYPLVVKADGLAAGKGTVIVNTPGPGGRLALELWGITQWTDVNLLVENRQVKKFISTITFPNTAAEKAILAGEVEIEFVPQGTLAERIRAGGFGIGGFYVRTGVGTLIAEGKEKRIIDGEEYLLEMPLRADYALIKAYKADRFGNLVYRGDTRSFNAVMAPAADITVAEVQDIVEVGELDPEVIVTPGIFVDRVVKIP